MRLMRTGRRVGAVGGDDFARSARDVEGGNWVRPLGGRTVDAGDGCLSDSSDPASLGPSINLRQSQAHPWPTSPFLPLPRSTASQLVTFLDLPIPARFGARIISREPVFASFEGDLTLFIYASKLGLLACRQWCVHE
jgi:hypothetical protein